MTAHIKSYRKVVIFPISTSATQLRVKSSRVYFQAKKMTVGLLCCLCQENVPCDGKLNDHMRTFHRVKFDVDLMHVLMVLTTEEKQSLMKQTEIRRIELNHMSNTLRKDVTEKITVSERDETQPPLLPVDEKQQLISNSSEDISVANKIRFWKGKDKQHSPKHLVKEMGQHGFNFFKKRESSRNETRVTNLLKRTLSQHLLGQKSADDTIEIFDEIFATTCSPDLNESIDGPFTQLLDDIDDTHEDVETNSTTSSATVDLTVDVIAEVNDISSSSHADAESDDPEVPRKVTKSNVSKTSTKAAYKYKCEDCGKSFKFLTSMKGHMNSKGGCGGQKKLR